MQHPGLIEEPHHCHVQQVAQGAGQPRLRQVQDQAQEVVAAKGACCV